jgi:hypothetical protein
MAFLNLKNVILSHIEKDFCGKKRPQFFQLFKKKIEIAKCLQQVPVGQPKYKKIYRN